MDASLVVALLLNEEGSDEAYALLEKWKTPRGRGPLGSVASGQPLLRGGGSGPGDELFVPRDEG